MTRSPSPFSTTSLGAVGGARGTAAGGLRVLIEFLTQYDASAVKQVEADVKTLQTAEASADKRSLSALQARETLQKRLAATQKAINAEFARQGSKAPAARRAVKDAEALGLKTAAGQLKLEAAGFGIGTKMNALLRTRLNQKRGELALTNLINTREATRLGVNEQLTAQQERLTRFQQLKAQLPQKLGGLALGALGGVFGGALIGVGFAAAEAILDRIEQGILDLVDPARHAREAIKELGAEINGLSEESGDRLVGTRKFLESLGIEADDHTVRLLAEAAAQQAAAKAVDAYVKIQLIKRHGDALDEENIKKIQQSLVDQAIATGDLTAQEKLSLTHGGTALLLDNRRAEAREILAEATRALAEAEQKARNEAILVAGAAQIAAFAADNLANSLRGVSQALVGPIDAQLSALREGAGPSARTRALEAQIEKLQGGGSAGRNRELANIQEERALILLRQRLRALGESINLEEFEGKFLLEAINAKIQALDKQAKAQDRLNKLLDLQFRASKQLRRQEGETIADFLERRAQENREILSEQRQLEQEAIRDDLEGLRQKTQDEVALAELAERKKEALLRSGQDKRLKALQKELEASKKADKAALEAKIKALEAAKAAAEKKAEDVVKFASSEAQRQIRIAISGAQSIADLAEITSSIQGTHAARGFLKAFGPTLVASGAITQVEFDALMRNLDSTLSSFLRQQSNFGTNALQDLARAGGFRGYAKGGIIPLTNASTPFGQNVRFGEQGTELGVILSNRVVQALNQQKPSQPMTIIVNRSPDPRRDAYRMKQAAKAAIGEALS